MTLINMSKRLMFSVCRVHSMVVHLKGHRNRTPNSCSERTDSNMGRRDRMAENTNIEHSGCT